MKRTSIKWRNDDRAAKMRARNFPVVDRVKLTCLVARELAKYQRKHGAKMRPERWRRCFGPIELAHVIHARGMGGVNSSAEEVAPLCHGHHREEEADSEAFAALYGLDLTAEAAAFAAGQGRDEGAPA